jgi:hypothetical protein
VIQMSSLSDAFRRLIASRNQKKAIIVTTAADIQGVPAGIQVVQADPANVFKVVIELRNQYLLLFRPSDPAAAHRSDAQTTPRPAVPETSLEGTLLEGARFTNIRFGIVYSQIAHHRLV